MSRALFGNTTDYPTVIVELGLSDQAASNATWGSGTWNTSKWSGREVVWTEVTDYVRSISTTRELNRDTGGFPAGTAVITLSNKDARFTPANTSGPYTSATGTTKIVPKVPVRIRATWAGTTYGIFFGRVNSWADDYPGVGKDCVTTITCSDVSADLALVQLATIASTGSGESAGQRINRILSAAGWRWGTDLGTSSLTTMQATTLGANALDLAQLTVASEGGVLFADGDGNLVFQESSYPASASRARTAQITFGSDAGEVRFADPQLTYDDTLIYNSIIFTRVGGAAQSATDSDSIALYGIRSRTRSDLICSSDAQALSLARNELLRYGRPEYRVSGLTVRGATSAATYWPLLLGSRFGDLCSAKVPTPSGLTLNRSVFVSGLSHVMSPDAGWVTRFGFTSASPWIGWDIGLWDSMTWTL